MSPRADENHDRDEDAVDGRKGSSVVDDVVSSSSSSSVSFPSWYASLSPSWGEPLVVPEWEETAAHASFRSANGWVGTDLVHHVDSPVRVVGYRAEWPSSSSSRGGGVGTTLTGAAVFTPRAESHKGVCHGGSMCALMDDAVGWCGFLATGKCAPWSGFTAQINTRLRRPVPVGSVLVVRATVASVEGRKVRIGARLFDPDATDDDDDESSYATCEGLFLLKKGVVATTTAERPRRT